MILSRSRIKRPFFFAAGNTRQPAREFYAFLCLHEFRFPKRSKQFELFVSRFVGGIAWCLKAMLFLFRQLVEFDKKGLGFLRVCSAATCAANFINRSRFSPCKNNLRLVQVEI